MLRVVSALGLALFVTIGSARPVSAHNSFVSSDPSDGATAATIPAQLSLVFVNAVPLGQVSVDFFNAAAVRTPLAGFQHGPAGQTEVLVAIPATAVGAVSFRWKLVAADGHTVTGRVGITINPPSSLASPDLATASSTVAVIPIDTDVSTDTGSGAGTATRWLLRVASFVGLVGLLGVLVTAGFLWPGSWGQRSLHRAAVWAVSLVALSSAGQFVDFMTVAGSFDVAIGTSYGFALVVRLLSLVVFAAYLFTWFPKDDELRWTVLAFGAVVLAGTWSWSGHPRSLRWPILGVPIDLVHLVAGSIWLGGLVFMAAVVMREADDGIQTIAVRRFAPVAGRCTAAIVVTGLIQSIRIDGGLSAFINTTHGRLVVAKVVLLGLMLVVANVNRQRVALHFHSGEPVATATKKQLARAMVTETVVGMVILGLSAVLVVNSPG